MKDIEQPLEITAQLIWDLKDIPSWRIYEKIRVYIEITGEHWAFKRKNKNNEKSWIFLWEESNGFLVLSLLFGAGVVEEQYQWTNSKKILIVWKENSKKIKR